VNWIGIIAVVFAFPFFTLGYRIAKRPAQPLVKCAFILASVVCAIPAILYLVYYTGCLGEPLWLYRIRSIPGSELAASPAGLFAGWFHFTIVPRLSLSRWGRRGLVPLVMAFSLAVPYLKPILKPRSIQAMRPEWREGVCLQSTFSTCGPAATATILNRFGLHTSEKEIAAEAFTSASGTENWYLARAIRRRGMKVAFECDKQLNGPLPAIVGVRLKQMGNSGHFIALLERRGDQFVFGDPMTGALTNTLAALSDRYEFTGFMLSIQPE
jgi:predicted double-glycine peptidase